MLWLPIIGAKSRLFFLHPNIRMAIKEFLMSVRATDSLIAEVVVASGLTNGPAMIVQAVDAEKKLITTVWFSHTQEAQVGIFPAGSLDRYEGTAAPAAKKAGKRGKKPAK
jgi:hypothetical protein